DAWGNRRDVTTLENYYSPGGGQGIWQGFFHRGYTGHEHLECFGLINMNGRLYDPLLGRMLSPDKYVQAPGFSQNFNRYSYAWNNPLTYSNPSGDFIVSTTVAAIYIGAHLIAGAYIAGVMANDHGNPDRWTWDAKTYKAIGVGALVGGLTGFSGLAMKGASIKGKAMLTKAGGKQLHSTMVSGVVNTISNYDSEQGVGWHTLGHFGAGALGGAIAGGDGGLFLGAFTGGSLNAAVNTTNKEYVDENGFGYTAFQGIVGGALSVVVGAGFAKIKPDVSLPFGKSDLAKGLNKGLWYGLQGSASDFAYTKRKYYTKRNIEQHLGVFAAAGVGGYLQSLLAYDLEIGSSSSKWHIQALNKGLRYGGGTAAAYMAEMTGTFFVKGNYNSFYRDGREQKAGYMIYKTLLYSTFHSN
ncbi:MAG: hypothetical protein JJU02_12430, partial [Cryomorphaceae bacterium]|nr:hypothetical protein [Cryomorphaceae bacterium]